MKTLNQNCYLGCSQGFTLMLARENLLSVMDTQQFYDYIRIVEKSLTTQQKQSVLNEVNVTMESHRISIDVKNILLMAELMTFRGDLLGLAGAGIDQFKNSASMLIPSKQQGRVFNVAI
ncbi:unnamed protein product [Paramecium octaurelia]|uniref:Uncharacterized protein n=1 Tax=Paramecium octaurelia TaxID=43137 RepID=A0A8S1YBT9_PAROT|nr:unnamed protein product [Paramecium octaurelia]